MPSVDLHGRIPPSNRFPVLSGTTHVCLEFLFVFVRENSHQENPCPSFMIKLCSPCLAATASSTDSSSPGKEFIPSEMELQSTPSSLWGSFNWLSPLVVSQEFTDSTLVWDLSQPPTSLRPSMVPVWIEPRGIRAKGMWQKRLFLSWLSSAECLISAVLGCRGCAGNRPHKC